MKTGVLGDDKERMRLYHRNETMEPDEAAWVEMQPNTTSRMSLGSRDSDENWWRYKERSFWDEEE